MGKVAAQIKQLGIVFNIEVINQLSQVVNCQIVDGVEVDQAEMASMEEMLKEASANTDLHRSDNREPDPQRPVLTNSPNRVSRNQSLIEPLGRSSMSVLAGDENDLLAETPVFT